MAEGGHDQRGQKINPSSAENAVLAEGDKVSQIFKNTDVSVIAGDQNIGTVNGQGQRGQLTKESPGPNVARHATLATGDHVSQHFINSKVYVAAGGGKSKHASAERNSPRHAILAEGDQVFQDFGNATVNVVAGDQYTTVMDGKQIISAGRSARNESVDETEGNQVASCTDVSVECETTHGAGLATLAEGNQVNQSFDNSTVNVVAGDLNITNVIKEIHVSQPSESMENILDQERRRLEAEKGFVAKTKRHLQNEIRGNPNIKARPTMMVIDMKGTSADGRGNGKSLFGRDLEEISLHQIHEPYNEKPTKHVTILGEAGAGKSTLSGIYSLAVANGDVETLANIQLVHFISASTLQTDSTTTAFNLFFTEQMAHDSQTELSSREQEAGAVWLKNNSTKLLITIDGLDQCLEEFGNKNYPRVTAITHAKANVIIANIMSGKIWRDARVLTTSRWNTYWDIKSEQKPDKVVGLRGLNDENLKQIAVSQSIDGYSMFAQLQNTSPKLLSLCRNPMFLNYTTKIFQNNRNKLPDSLAGLMSAFFREFLSSSSGKYYGQITRLGYDAMRENKFVFSHSYLSSHGIDPKQLDDFLSTGVLLQDCRDTVNSFDKSSAFSHQTMQEFCCALHVPSLPREEIKEFVANELNHSRMELTRQLLYGLILDDKVTKPMSNYLSDRRTSIQECRELLLESLDVMMENGIITDFQTIKLLSECGDETIQNRMEKAQRIVINDLPYLLKNDHILLNTMIKRLSPLAEVCFHEFNLEPSVIPHVKGFLPFVDLFKVDLLGINDRYFAPECIAGYLDILRQSHSSKICLLYCDLTTEKLGMIAQECRLLDIQLEKLNIKDPTMPSDAYSDVASVAKVTKCTEVIFSRCDLSKKKLEYFVMGCKQSQVSLQKLVVFDRTMPPDAYYDVAAVVKATKCNEMFFGGCDLSKQKLERLGSGCKESQVLIPVLTISCSHSTATEDDISALCDLMTFAVQKVYLHHWNIDAKERQRLQETLQLESSKVIRLQLPSGDAYNKNRPVEEPTGQAVTITPYQENPENDAM